MRTPDGYIWWVVLFVREIIKTFPGAPTKYGSGPAVSNIIVFLLLSVVVPGAGGGWHKVRADRVRQTDRTQPRRRRPRRHQRHRRYQRHWRYQRVNGRTVTTTTMKAAAAAAATGAYLRHRRRRLWRAHGRYACNNITRTRTGRDGGHDDFQYTPATAGWWKKPRINSRRITRGRVL